MKSKIIFPMIIFAATVNSFAAEKIKCPEVSSSVPEGKTIADYQSFFELNSIVAKTNVTVNYVEQFKNEFEKFPSSLQRELNRAGNKIHIMEGAGVTVDPTWVPSHEKTFDGRPWSEVPGGGGSTAKGFIKSPTRIVINNMYQNHGSSNLFLHEHGHSLDSIKSRHGISNSKVWSDLLASEAGVNSFLTDVCGDYCTDNVEEGFAELFANYYACAESKAQLELELPRVAEFFKRFQSTKNLQKIWEDETTAVEEDSSSVTLRQRGEQVRDRAIQIWGKLFPRP